MPLRLGEVLVRTGIILEPQLQEALMAQSITGSRLGTCLIELGHLEEDRLGEILAAKHEVGYVSRRRLESVDPEVLATVPSDLLRKHQAIPFEITATVLHVAMIDPQDLLARAELSSASGLRIEAWVAAEGVVQESMERHLDVPIALPAVSFSRRAMPH